MNTHSPQCCNVLLISKPLTCIKVVASPLPDPSVPLAVCANKQSVESQTLVSFFLLPLSDASEIQHQGLKVVSSRACRKVCGVSSRLVTDVGGQY